MGQQVSTNRRRRLVEDYEVKIKELEFRPFGGWNYSYDEAYMKYCSFTIWALVTAGSLAVDWREAAIVLGGSLWGQETIKNKGQFGSGASWVHNIQAGYCLYHYAFKGNKKMLVFLGVLAEATGDIGAVIEEQMKGEKMYAHDAHVEGVAIGLVAAFVLDKMFTKKQPVDISGGVLN